MGGGVFFNLDHLLGRSRPYLESHSIIATPSWQPSNLSITQKCHPSTSLPLSQASDILDIVESFFEVGRTKDTTILQHIQLNDPRFTSFSDVPPYDLKDYETTLTLETLRFVSISDYNYVLTNTRISIFGETAVVAAELNQKGMLVDNKNYTGEHISIDGRVTFVLVMVNDSWRIVHIHLSKI